MCSKFVSTPRSNRVNAMIATMPATHGVFCVSVYTHAEVRQADYVGNGKSVIDSSAEFKGNRTYSSYKSL